MCPIRLEFGLERASPILSLASSLAFSLSHLPFISIQLSHVQPPLIQPWFHLTGLDQLTPKVPTPRGSECPRDLSLHPYCASCPGSFFSLPLQVPTGCLHMQSHIRLLLDLACGIFASTVTAILLTSMTKNLLVAIGSIQLNSKTSATGSSQVSVPAPAPALAR